jgi:hypothetical protein
MKTSVWIISAVMSVSAVWCQTSAKPAPAKPKSATAAVSPNAPPPDAEKINDSEWRSKDKSDRVWIHRRTPFGFVKVEEKPEGAASVAANENLTQVVSVAGETVNFMKPTPFGAARWSKKTSDLNAEEKEAFERSKSKPAASKE